MQGRPAPAQVWRSFQEKFNSAQVETNKLNAGFWPVAPANARNWRNPAGSRLPEWGPVQAPVGSGAAVVTSSCWQTGTKRDQQKYLSEGTCLGWGESPHPCPVTPGAHYCWKQWRV
ncbi:MAG: hypothetical protein HOO93_14800 [Methyloglobulus sp.]|nr:hypothetical protein [Methyloglobulus sp.]